MIQYLLFISLLKFKTARMWISLVNREKKDGVKISRFTVRSFKKNIIQSLTLPKKLSNSVSLTLSVSLKLSSFSFLAAF